MACTVSEGTRVDVAKFLSALSTLWLYSATSVRAGSSASNLLAVLFHGLDGVEQPRGSVRNLSEVT